MVRIRLSRMGKKNQPYYRIAVYDARTKRDGKYIERIGNYYPLAKESDKKLVIKRDRLAYWLKQGAQLTESMRLHLKKVKLV